MIRSLVSIGLAAAASYGVARTAMAMRDVIPGAERFDRENHRSDTVTLLEGPAYLVGAIAGLVAGTQGRTAAAASLATSAAGVLGAVDDLAETGSAKGLRGHLGALRHGEVTTGLLKVIGISTAGMGAAAILLNGSGAERRASGVVLGTADILASGALIAGTANLFNLLDLRPGRALKAGALVAAAAPVSVREAPLLAASLGASGGVIVPDLRGESMLGDCGANALGALLGVHAVSVLGSRARAGLLVVVVGLTVASEKISFTRVIEATPVLRELDALGR